MAGINSKLSQHDIRNTDIDFNNWIEQGVYLLLNDNGNTSNGPSGGKYSITIVLGYKIGGTVQICFPANGNTAYWRIFYGTWKPWRSF